MTNAFKIKTSALMCSVALTLPLMAGAEETIVVTAQQDAGADAPTAGYTAKTSTGATKTDKPLITTGQSISVITRQQIDDQGAMDLNQVLNYTPGVFTNFAGAATRFDTISLRGFHGGDVDNTFLDGLRVMSDSGSHNNLQVDPWFLERVDVIKGPSSALYGQTVPGGLVNMTTKCPQFSEEGHFRLYGGTQNTKGGAFDYTNAINDQWAFRITGMTRSSDTQYDHTREERYAISPSLLWQPNENTSLLLKAYWQKDPSGGYHSAVPSDGSLNERHGSRLSRSFYDGESDLDQYKRREQIYSYDFAHVINDTWSVHSTGSYTHSNVAIDQVYQGGWVGDSDLLARYYTGERSSLDAFAMDNRVQADFTTGAVDHKVVLGAEYHQYKNDLWDGGAYGTYLNAATGASGGSALFQDPALTIPGYYNDNNNTRRYYQTGVYLQDEMVMNQWHLDVSGRYDRIVSKQVSHSYDTSVRRSDDHVSGRASLLYAFANGVSPYISYSQAITPTSLTGADGNLLKPTTSEQYEAGLKYQPVSSSDLYTIVVYDLMQKDVANRDIITATYTPSGKVHSQGIELEAHNQITPHLSTLAGYSLNHIRFKDSVDGNDGHTPYVSPNQTASFWGHYRFDYGISVGAGVRYIGKQWADNENTLHVPSVTLLDASVRADLGAWDSRLKGAYVQVNANNLTDRDYVAACYGTGCCYWGAERSVLATVGYDF